MARRGVWDPTGPSLYAKARFLDPKLGRFLTQDSFLGSIDEPPSLHRYLYANDNPTRFVDPTGHAAKDWIWGIEGEVERGAKATARMVLGPLRPAFNIAERSIREKSVVAGVKGEIRDTFNQFGAMDTAERYYKEGAGLPRAALEGGREHVANMVAGVVPVRDIPTMLDSSENPWVRAEAAANAVAKTATLALGIVGGGAPRAGVLEEGLSGTRVAPVESSVVTADVVQASTRADAAMGAVSASSNFGSLRDTVRFLREKGVTDPGVRRQMLEAGFESTVGTDTPASLARFDKLFARPLRTGRGYTGRLGNIETRVTTLDTAVEMERAGLQPRFEYRAGARFADVVGIDPATGRPARAVQVVKALEQTGGINPREIPAKLDIQSELKLPVEFRISGSQ